MKILPYNQPCNIDIVLLHFSFDYGDKFWIIKWKQFTCECTSAKCRYNKVTIHKTIEDFNKKMQEDDTEEPFM